MTLTALAAILRVPLEQVLREEVLRCIHLPLAMGGLGITAAAFIAPFACDASFNADIEGAETQKSLTSQLNKTIVGTLPEDLVAHLKLGENAGWIYSMQPNPHYGQGILLQVTGHSDVVCICSCRYRSTQRELALHALGCSKVHEPNVSSRHATIINFCKRNGIAISDEPVVYHDGISTKRCDLVSFGHPGPRTVCGQLHAC